MKAFTSVGSRTRCPNCGGVADIIDGTYEFVDDVLVKIRDVGLTLDELKILSAAAEAVRTGEQTSDEFAAAHPEVAPIIQLITVHVGQRDWPLFFLSLLAAVIIMFGQMELQKEGVLAPTPPATTQALTDDDLDAISERVKSECAPPSKPPRSKTPAAKRKRPPKTHGKHKPHKR